MSFESRSAALEFAFKQHPSQPEDQVLSSAEKFHEFLTKETDKYQYSVTALAEPVKEPEPEKAAAPPAETPKVAEPPKTA